MTSHFPPLFTFPTKPAFASLHQATTQKSVHLALTVWTRPPPSSCSSAFLITLSCHTAPLVIHHSPNNTPPYLSYIPLPAIHSLLITYITQKKSNHAVKSTSSRPSRYTTSIPLLTTIRSSKGFRAQPK